MKKLVLALLPALVTLYSCGQKSSSYQSDANDTIPIVHQHQEFSEAVDSLVYQELWGNSCFKGVAYVTEAKSIRIVAHTSLVKRGEFTDTGTDSYRGIIEKGLTNYISSNQFGKTALTGIYDDIPVYYRNKMIGSDTIISEACCLFPEEFSKYEIFVALMSIGPTTDIEKMCGAAIEGIISEIVRRDMIGLMIQKDSVMEGNSGVWGYFQSLCKNKGAEIWTHSDTRNDSLDVWNAVVMLDLFAGGKQDKYPQKELKKALRDMALEQAYRESHGGDEYKGDNPGEKFLFKLLEKAAYYAPDISEIADSIEDNGKRGFVNFPDWTGMNDLYRFSVYKGSDGRFKVKCAHRF